MCWVIYSRTARKCAHGCQTRKKQIYLKSFLNPVRNSATMDYFHMWWMTSVVHSALLKCEFVQTEVNVESSDWFRCDVTSLWENKTGFTLNSPSSSSDPETSVACEIPARYLWFKGTFQYFLAACLYRFIPAVNIKVQNEHCGHCLRDRECLIQFTLINKFSGCLFNLLETSLKT